MILSALKHYLACFALAYGIVAVLGSIALIAILKLAQCTADYEQFCQEGVLGLGDPLQELTEEAACSRRLHSLATISELPVAAAMSRV